MLLDPELLCPDGVVFDAVSHTYTIDGLPAPAASTILKVVNPDQYAGIREDVLMRAAVRGSARHLMVALDVRGELDHTSLGDDIIDDYVAWMEFCDRYKLEVTHSERVVASRNHHFAGTLDLAGTLLYKGTRDHWLIDIKCTAALPSLVGVQTAGYLLAAEESIGFDRKTRRGCLWIRGGVAKFVELTCKSDRAAFISGRTILNWRESQ